MKPLKKDTRKNIPTKGARLKWESLRDLKPVELTGQMVQGKVVVRQSHNNNTRFLVP